MPHISMNELMVFSKIRRGTAFDLFEKLDKIAEIGKTALKGDIHNPLIGAAQ